MQSFKVAIKHGRGEREERERRYRERGEREGKREALTEELCMRATFPVTYSILFILTVQQAIAE